MAPAQQKAGTLDEFLEPLHIDDKLVVKLSRGLGETFKKLAAESSTQFLPTPISESILRHVNGTDHGRGRYLAIDIGGTNLRCGFVELLPGATIGADSHWDDERAILSPQTKGHSDEVPAPTSSVPRLRRLLEKSWPIGEYLKNENADGLFAWIGQRVASVVDQGCKEFGLDQTVELPMGVTFSFPMVQRSLTEATLMSMGKGFAITSQLDLGSFLLKGYETARGNLPHIRIAAIANDAVATLVSFVYQFQAGAGQKAAMGLICGTGSNATIPLRLSSLHPDKRPKTVSVIPGQAGQDVRLAVNTEWSINGSAPPLRKLGLISCWDTELDMAGEAPGFQPLEYMTSGRYLGELGRLIFVDYLTTILGRSRDELPSKLRRKFGLNTTYLSHYGRRGRGSLLDQLENEFPLENEKSQFQWTNDMAEALRHIALAIERRAAGIVAAATVGLLACAEEIPSVSSKSSCSDQKALELVVGYTGGCITGFQDYLTDCQNFLDKIIALEHGEDARVRVTLSPCHDGGITGAGILVPAALSSEST